MYEGGTIRDECRVREEGMVLCTMGALQPFTNLIANGKNFI